MPNRAQTLATYADIEAAPEYLVAEIIDGVLHTHHHGMMHHALMLMNSIHVFAKRPEYECVHLPQMHFDDHVIVPDMAGWKHGRIKDNGAPWCQQPIPNWVMEIIYPHTEALDRGAKRRIYAEAGVEYLWLLNPCERVLETFTLTNGCWLLTGVATGSDTVQLAPFPALSFPLLELCRQPFDDADGGTTES